MDINLFSDLSLWVFVRSETIMTTTAEWKEIGRIRKEIHPAYIYVRNQNLSQGFIVGIFVGILSLNPVIFAIFLIQEA